VVWGRGAAPARLIVVGGTPGDEEDLTGVPFTGREGRLVRRLLDEAGFDDGVFYTYAVKCRSRGEPTRAEVNECRTWLWQELRATGPTVVLTLGALPTRLLLGLKKSFKLADWTGEFHSVGFMGGVVAPWYAPNHILQNGRKADRAAVEFFKLVWGACHGSS
jgi:DNA polymerase